MARPPFTALNIQQLSAKVCRGVYPAVSSSYSKNLSNIIKQMLQIVPSNRPTSSELLEMPELLYNLSETCAKLSPDNLSKDLLGTIMMPKKLNELGNRLPRAKYSREKLKRMNSEPCRLPSVHESKSRLGSAAARKKWDLDKPENKFEPRSVVHSKKQDENYHLSKQTRSSRYYSKENIDRGVLQRAAENILPTNRVSRVIDFSRRNSSNSRVSEERKIPNNNNISYEHRQHSAHRRPPYHAGAVGMAKPPLANVNMNIPSPKLIDPYAESPRYVKPPLGQAKPGLPPIGQKPGFGGMNANKRNVIHENYNFGGGFNYHRNNSQFRYN